VTSGAWAWAFVPAVAGRWRGLPRPVQRYGLLALFGSAAFCAYVIRVGGDFMLNRFFVSVLPLAATAVEIGLRNRLAERPWRSRTGWIFASIAAVACAAAVVPVPVVGPLEKKWNVAAEESFYKLSSLRPLVVETPYFQHAQRLAKSFAARGLYPKLGEGCVGMIAYYSDLPLVDRYGLTNWNIGHAPIRARGRPGHEKLATREQLIAEGAVFSLENLWPGHEAQTQFRVDGHPYFLLQWDDTLVAELSKVRGASLPAIRTESGDPATLQFYDQFLAHSKRRTEVVEALRAHLERLSAAADPIETLRFDDDRWPSTVTVTGEAFGPGPESEPLPSQGPIAGWFGARFVNSFHGGDVTTGTLEVPLQKGGTEVRLLVGGGSDCATTYAALFVNGVENGRACGQNDEVLRTVVLPLPPEAAEVTLRLIDNATGPWGHLLVDHAMVIGATPASPLTTSSDRR
jgi:hypothetical protein